MADDPEHLLIIRPDSSLANTAAGAKRIMSAMVGETLALTRQEQSAHSSRVSALEAEITNLEHELDEAADGGQLFDPRIASLIMRYSNVVTALETITGQQTAASPAPQPVNYDAEIPPDRMAAFTALAQRSIARGDDTPEKLARVLSELDTKAPAFSQRLWAFLKGAGAKGSYEPDWGKIYESIAVNAVAKLEQELKDASGIGFLFSPETAALVRHYINALVKLETDKRKQKLTFESDLLKREIGWLEWKLLDAADGGQLFDLNIANLITQYARTVAELGDFGYYPSAQSSSQVPQAGWMEMKFWELGLTGVDLSGEPKLKHLWCKGKNLIELNLSYVPKLTCLNCSDNYLSELDLSRLPKLTWLSCSGNNITELDLSYVPKLTWLNCSHNNITKLDLSHVPKLTWLNCQGNNLAELDIRPLHHLETLLCYKTPRLLQRPDQHFDQ